MDRTVYQDPLVSRYTSQGMQALFSEETRFRTWRRCWIALAEAQYELGLTDIITPAMLDSLRSQADNIDYEAAARKEREIRHDVMAHVHVYGQQCPEAAGIIHLGATSQFVVCNTDLILHKKALALLKRSLVNVIANLAAFCREHKDVVTLGYTHYQPAQPTTVGKRHTLYIQDLLMDLDAMEFTLGLIHARGAKGTVGTQASFIELFKGDHQKVRDLDLLVARKLGFDSVFAVTGQTYPRKLDAKIAETLAGIGISSHKFGVDLRLLSNLKVQEEPFEKNQTGSSAMAYKRNPMRSERMTGLSRKLMGLVANFHATAANQWFERTLDDSAIRRMDIPQMYLLTDAILRLYHNISSQMVVYAKQIDRYLDQELPFMATEAILMDAVSRGKSRQEMHERIKVHAVASGKRVKEDGAANDLVARMAADTEIPFCEEELASLVHDRQRFSGRAAQQTDEFLDEVVGPRLLLHKDLLGGVDASLKV